MTEESENAFEVPPTAEPAATVDAAPETPLEPAPVTPMEPAPITPMEPTSVSPMDPAPVTTLAAAPAAAGQPAMPAAPIPPVPPVGWQAPPVAVATKGERTTLAMAAGILLVLGGIGGILLGLLVAIVGGSVISSLDFSQFKNVPDLNGANPGALAGGVVAFFGAVVVAYSIAYLLAGIGVLRNSNWARVLGIIVGIISGLVWLSGLAGANNTQNAAGSVGAGLFSIMALGIHLYIVVVLLFFWRSKPSVA